jgi:adenosylmethionine-8-amino-7-oxononanoate aminotransferase
MELVHAQCSIAFHGPYLYLIEKLLPMMPHKSMDSFFFWNSGTEAVEAAMKMARIITEKQNIITMQGLISVISVSFRYSPISIQADTTGGRLELWPLPKAR